MPEVLLDIKDLKTHFLTFRGVMPAVDGISFQLRQGESLGLVGESGSGKSVTGYSIIRLIQPPGKIVAGDIEYKGRSILEMSEKELQAMRGAQISMIFQNPRTCLNPVLPIGKQIDRIYRQHTNASAREAREKRLETLNRVRIGDPVRFSKSYPHQLSGGMCQRAMIVMAVVCNPELLIADEPTTGLDVTIQRQIMELLGEMREVFNATQILITHDLGVVAETCDRVVVMYAGLIMESASTKVLFSRPAHPYTVGLLESIPRLDRNVAPALIPGHVPGMYNRPTGCPYNPRCSLAQDICKETMPQPQILGDDHWIACHFSIDSS